MNFRMTDIQVEQHMQDVRRQVARGRARSACRDRARAASASRVPRLRRRVGFTLIEAGLRLLAADNAARIRPGRDTA
jgi:hypothetical protein